VKRDQETLRGAACTEGFHAFEMVRKLVAISSLAIAEPGGGVHVVLDAKLGRPVTPTVRQSGLRRVGSLRA
jgi:hypothetical protein